MFIECEYLGSGIECNTYLNDCEKCSFKHPEIKKQYEEQKEKERIKREKRNKLLFNSTLIFCIIVIILMINNCITSITSCLL